MRGPIGTARHDLAPCLVTRLGPTIEGERARQSFGAAKERSS
jgi:hypothetical protein